MLILPVHWMRFLEDVPGARPLRALDRDRRKKLLQLAEFVAQSNVYESAERTVDYLLSLCRDADPDPVPDLPWLATRSNDEFEALWALDVGSTAMMKLIPQMRFTARMLKTRRR